MPYAQPPPLAFKTNETLPKSKIPKLKQVLSQTKRDGVGVGVEVGTGGNGESGSGRLKPM